MIGDITWADVLNNHQCDFIWTGNIRIEAFDEYGNFPCLDRDITSLYSVIGEIG